MGVGVEIIRIKAVLSSTGLELELSLTEVDNHKLGLFRIMDHFSIITYFL